MTYDPTEYINSLYRPQEEAALSAYNAAAGQINTQITNANQEYQPLRNQAYVDFLNAGRTNSENTANMGLSSAGGGVQTLQQRNKNTLVNTNASIGLEQQKYVQDLQNSLMTQQAQRDQNLANIATSKGTALINAKDTEFSKAWSMLQSGSITATQFKAMTGYDAAAVGTYLSSSGSGSGGSKYTGTPAEIYSQMVLDGYSTDVAYALSGYVPSTSRASSSTTDVSTPAKKSAWYDSYYGNN